MTDRPIIFSGMMVRAMLDGRKTQTRRVIKATVPPPPSVDNIHPNHVAKHGAPYLDAYCGARRTASNPRGMRDTWCWWTRDDRPGPTFKVGYIPGDLLWVREGHYLTDDGDFERAVYAADDGPVQKHLAEVEALPSYFSAELRARHKRLRPSIYMPRWASRLTLEVTAVKVERLQDISQENARAEGCGWADTGKSDDNYLLVGEPRAAYSNLWAHINGPKSWEANPWVAALTFEAHRCNIDAVAKGAPR